MSKMFRIAFIALVLACSISTVKADCPGSVPVGTCSMEQPTPPETTKPDEKETKTVYDILVIWLKSFTR